MPEHDAKRLEIARQVQSSLATENELMPIQARLFVRSLQTAWHVPQIQWDDSESASQLYDARRLIYAAQLLQKLEGPESAEAITCYRRAGELLEWLARANDRMRTVAPIDLLAAGAYQLGGLPAMAAGLMAQLDFEDQGVQLYSTFLSGDFDGVLALTAKFWEANQDMIVPGAMDRLLQEDNEDKMSWYFTTEVVRCLGLISDSIRRGNEERLARALFKLEKLEGLAVRTLSEDASLLVTLIYAVSNRFRAASIYQPIRQLAALNDKYSERLELFARKQFGRGRGILWSSQLRGLERLIRDSSFALCTPTGSGKTLVANLALVKELMLRQEEGVAPLGLYLVPSRALAGEVEAKLTDELGDDFIVTGLYGGADWGITDYWLDADKPTVLIATVEKADALVRYLGPLLFSRLHLLIIDEAHQVVSEDSMSARIAFAEHSSRSLRLEAFVSRVLAHSPDIVRIALTAVAGGAAMPVARWMENNADAVPEGLSYRSTRQVVGAMEVYPQRAPRLQLEQMNGQPLYVRGREAPVYLNLRTPPMPQLPAVMRNSIYRFNQLSVLWTALHLVKGERRVLISVMQQPEKTMSWFAQALDLPVWQEVSQFSPPEDIELRGRYEEARQSCIDYCGPDSYELALLNRGIATSHGQMPQRLRRLMTDLIDRRICPITVATATLTEGVNLPFDLIFLTSLRRSFFDHDQNQLTDSPISTAEFRNLAGRAGRPGAANGMEGMTFIPLPQSPSSTAKATIPRQRVQIDSLRRDYDDLIERLAADEYQQAVTSPLSLLLDTLRQNAETMLGITDEATFLNWLEAVVPSDVSQHVGTDEESPESRFADAVDELDGVLLGALVELQGFQEAELDGTAAEAFLASLWQRTFSKVTLVQEAWMERAFIRRGRGVVQAIYPDAEEREALYQYGYSPAIGRRFDPVSVEIEEVLTNSEGYANYSPNERLQLFERIGDLLEGDRGYGFRVRNTQGDQALLQNWRGVLAWCMRLPDASRPDPERLRSWQRFVTDNLEFRLGVAIGAVVSRAWSDGTAEPFEVPSLEMWKETTGLPWFGFWAKELLRWGTLEPFVAFALARGMAKTRDEALGRRTEFVQWITEEVGEFDDEDLIDPQMFLKWQRTLPKPDSVPQGNAESIVQLTGTDGRRGHYDVLPVEIDGDVRWIDASGFELARSAEIPSWLNGDRYKADYFLRFANGPIVTAADPY